MQRILFVTLLVVSCLAQKPTPVWPPVFSQQFVESYKSGPVVVSGRFYYDSTKNAERIDRVDGQFNQVCDNLQPDVKTACQQLVTDGKRWIVFPEKRDCCMCCDASHGCGIESRDWLRTGKYEGTEVIREQTFDKWSVMDGSATLYYYAAQDERQTPRKILDPTNTKDFIMNSFNENPIPDSVFQLPSYCTNLCPSSSICGIFRNERTAEQ